MYIEGFLHEQTVEVGILPIDFGRTIHCLVRVHPVY